MFDLNESSTFTKYIAAGSPYTPELVLARLALEPHWQLRRRVAENPHTPPEILARLARDEHPDVRLSLWDNPAIDEATLEALSQDESADVRLAIASDPRLPEKILRRLVQDENPYVAERAYRSFNLKYPTQQPTQLQPRAANIDMHEAV